MTRMTPDKADEKIARLEKALAEANVVLADLKSTVREAQGMTDEIRKMIEDGFEDKIADKVASTLTEYQDSLDKAIEDAQAAVFKRFDELTNMLLGETKKVRGRGESMEMFVKKVVDRRDG